MTRHPLTAIREEHGWTMAHLAGLVARASGANMAAGRQKVYRWEGGVRPELVAQYALARVLGVDRVTVESAPWPEWLLTVASDAASMRTPWTDGNALTMLVGALGAHTDRRGFLILAGTSALATMAPAWAEPWELIPGDKVTRASEGGRVDDEITHAIERRMVQLWRLDDAIGGDRCALLADADLRLTVSLIKNGTYSSAVERRLYSLAAGLCRSAGWGAFDADRDAAAERYYHAGMRAARRAGDRDAAAFILSNMALQQNFTGDGRTAIGYLDGARRIVGRHGSAAVRAMLDLVQVRSCSAIGETREAERLLKTADEHWDNRSGDDPDWIYWMSRPSEHWGANLALVHLGLTFDVEDRLTRWIAREGNPYNRDHAFALTVIASAQLARGEMDAALATARQALRTKQLVESTRIADELAGFVQRLPDNERTAAEFREEIGLYRKGTHAP